MLRNQYFRRTHRVTLGVCFAFEGNNLELMPFRVLNDENIPPPADTVSSVVGRFLSGNAAKHLEHSVPQMLDRADASSKDVSAFVTLVHPTVLKPQSVNGVSYCPPQDTRSFDRGSVFLRDSRRRTAQKLLKKREETLDSSIDEELENKRTVQFSQNSSSSRPKVFNEYKSFFHRKSVRITTRTVVDNASSRGSEFNSTFTSLEESSYKLRQLSLQNRSTEKPSESHKCDMSHNLMTTAPGHRENDSHFRWHGNEAELPVENSAQPFYECVMVYAGCVKIGIQKMYTMTLDKSIKHLTESESNFRTVLVQVYQYYTVVRSSSKKIRLVLPNSCIALCLSSPTMPMYVGVIMSLQRGGHECMVFGADRSLLPHGCEEHQKYVHRFGLTCLTTSFDQNIFACSAFPPSPVRLMHFLNFAKSFLAPKPKDPGAKNAATPKLFRAKRGIVCFSWSLAVLANKLASDAVGVTRSLALLRVCSRAGPTAWSIPLLILCLFSLLYLLLAFASPNQWRRPPCRAFSLQQLFVFG
ncbi:hypothetical protein L596_004152 [Steinernema carpocapsae]|uniref:Uncharacterized protein n=1 Tax=Steinernema carpocapsae TaxID=34508 RepID=A0A4U8UUW9_STECR|nr:hypothetical protein L596_004152 [Steinernema carpocapsae]